MQNNAIRVLDCKLKAAFTPDPAPRGAVPGPCGMLRHFHRNVAALQHNAALTAERDATQDKTTHRAVAGPGKKETEEREIFHC